MEKILQELEGHIKELFHNDSSGHDIYHLKRTLHNALTIQEQEWGDRLIIAISALLHDIHRIIQKENWTFCSPKDSLPIVKEILDKVDLTQDHKKKILYCIEYHEEYDFSE